MAQDYPKDEGRTMETTTTTPKIGACTQVDDGTDEAIQKQMMDMSKGMQGNVLRPTFAAREPITSAIGMPDRTEHDDVDGDPATPVTRRSSTRRTIRLSWA
jgi:hypothetical protein